MKTAKEYITSLKKLKKKVYCQGQLIKDVVGHPLFQPHINAAAMCYRLAWEKEYEGIATAVSHLSGKKINRFTHIHQNPDDLVKKIKLLRAVGQRTGTCFQRCAGWDGLHTMYILTHEIDSKYSTDYHQRYINFLKYVQDEDLMCAAGMTDPKGDRSLPPHKQPDPDLYLRVVEEKAGGIIVCGAKAHQTGGINSHEILVLPTTALADEDKDYAVAFAVPADTEGVTYIFGRQTNDTRRLEGDLTDTGNPAFGVVGGEALIVFDHVFVPWERVYMYREYDMARRGVEIFASTHRQNYGGCKVGVMDVLIGATSLMAEYNGTGNASHIKDKLVEMVHLNESLYSGAIGAGMEGMATASGACLVDPLLANTVKQNITRFIYEICRLSHDISGGILATLPSWADIKHPVVGRVLEKYLAGSKGVSVENKARILRLIENMTGGTALVEAMHGAGSPQAQRVIMLRQVNMRQKQELARRLSGIKN